MKEQKYLIAIALAEQNKKRIMPLGGKTFTQNDSTGNAPVKEAQKIILDLLLRLFQRTNEGNLKIADVEKGILLAEISFKDMQNSIPKIKSDWIKTGDTATFINKLIFTSSNVWSVDHNKYEGIKFKNLKT